MTLMKELEVDSPKQRSAPAFGGGSRVRQGDFADITGTHYNTTTR